MSLKSLDFSTAEISCASFFDPKSLNQRHTSKSKRICKHGCLSLDFNAERLSQSSYHRENAGDIFCHKLRMTRHFWEGGVKFILPVLNMHPSSTKVRV